MRTGEPLPAVGDVLAALATGMWHWDTATGLVAADAEAARLRVEVTEAGDDLPHKRRPGELASSGRGLVLIELLADEWGVNPRGEGKTIWFDVYERR